MGDKAELQGQHRRLGAVGHIELGQDGAHIVAHCAVGELHAAGDLGVAIRERLRERGFTGSLSAVYRFLTQLTPTQPDVTVRVETPPGQEAQVDFGYAGRMIDPATGALRKAWAFVMVLAWSRFMYVEFVWDQSVATWLLLHRGPSG